MFPLPHLRGSHKPNPRAFTTGTFPPYIDPAQPPTKKQPFAALRAQNWVSSLDIILPTEMAEIVVQELANKTVRFAKVVMKLGDVLDGEFFTEAIKKGDVMMMSEGRSGVDNRFELINGLLRLELDKATYERAGLLGKPMRDGGPKHKDNRYAIEIDLRQPSMLHGRKGFERIVWACKNVLHHSLTWLFFDRCTDSKVEVSDALEKHGPRWISSRCVQTTIENVKLPYFTKTFSLNTIDGEQAAEIEEWLGLVILQSPRVHAKDGPNAFICRYSLPKQVADQLDEEISTGKVTLMQWHGFLPYSFVLEILLQLKKDIPAQIWWALRSKGLRHGHDALAVLSPSTDDKDRRGYISGDTPTGANNPSVLRQDRCCGGSKGCTLDMIDCAGVEIGLDAIGGSIGLTYGGGGQVGRDTVGGFIDFEGFRGGWHISLQESGTSTSRL